MRGPVFLRTGSNPSPTPPPAPPRSEAFPWDAARPPPTAPRRGPARAQFLDSTGGLRRGWGRGARGGGPAAAGGGRGAAAGGQGAGRRGEFLACGPHALRANPEPASLSVTRGTRPGVCWQGRRGGGGGEEGGELSDRLAGQAGNCSSQLPWP